MMAAPAPETSPSGLPDLSEGEFRLLADILHRDTGIRLAAGKRGLVVSRLARRLRALGVEGFAAYCRHLQGPGGAEERVRMISALTTNVTAFFREPHHFDLLRQQVLPPLLRRVTRAGGRLRLWSAGCSSGEEAYSLAMVVLEICPDADAHDILILATDVDPAMIACARAGLYPADAAARMPWARGHFDPVPGDPDRVTVGPRLRRLVRPAQLNLFGQWPMRGRFDVILCRNVVIYFDAAGQAALWQRFAQALAPGGHLLIGHSERIDPGTAALFEPVGITAYRRRDAGDAPATAPAQGPQPCQEA